MSFVPSAALCISCFEHSGPSFHAHFAGTSSSSIFLPGRGNPRCSNAVADDSAGMSGRTPSIDKGAAEVGVHAVFYTDDFFLCLDFAGELTDLHNGPWEHTSPRRLKPRRGLISSSRCYINTALLPHLEIRNKNAVITQKLRLFCFFRARI